MPSNMSSNMPRKPPTKDERLAAALRENLKRRKQAARAQSAAPLGDAAKPVPERPNTAQKPG